MTYSFIVAAYNIEIFIESCLNSLSKIEFSSVEFIVVDDGSTDFTSSIIDKFTFNDPRFKVFHKANGGLISARKFGIQKATGEFVIFVDGDDYVIPTEFNKIAMQVELNKPDLVIFNYLKEFNKKLSNVPLDIKELEANTNKDLVDLKNNELFLSTYLWNKVFSRKKILYLYDSISNNITIGEDAAVTFPYYIGAKKIITIDCSFYVYRQHQFSMLKAQPNIEKDKLGFKELFNSLNKNLSKKYKKQAALIIKTLESGLSLDHHPSLNKDLESLNKPE
jgi:glycosyltransferase involved in cell wall biosynthesis